MTRRARLGLIGMLGVGLLQGTACAKGREQGPAPELWEAAFAL